MRAKYIWLVALIAISCGEPKEHPVKDMGTFRVISSNGLVTFKFVQGVENKAIATSMADDMYSVGGGVLSVNGVGYMTVAVRNLPLLSCNACSVENAEPLVLDTLNMAIHAGSVDLSDLVVSSYLGLSAVNTGEYKFSGSAPFFNVYNVNLATVKAYNLVTDSTYVNSYAAVATEVNATKVVNVFINASGDINYKGNPPIVRATIMGTGRLVKK
jgi:hypothetical protein